METWLTQGIISGVIANALTTIVSHIGNKSRKTLQQLFIEDSSFNDILKKAIASVATSTELDNEQRSAKLRLFFSSPDVEAIIRQIYASKLTINKNGNYLESIRTEFLACMSLYLDEPQQNHKEFSEQLFNALLEGCECALKIAIDNGLLSAHEAKSSLRHSMILDELATIKKNLNFLNASNKPNIEDILEFEKKISSTSC